MYRTIVGSGRRAAGAAAIAALAAGVVIAPVAADAADAIPAEATKIFSERCSVCHGPAGKGDGPGAAGLTPKPRDLSSAEWQKSVTDEHIETIVLKGGPAVGKSPLMPPNPDLEGKADVVKGLRALVRGLGADKK